MLLVPRQLQRAGMTGNVPYYGGRFSPAQAYAAAHPSGRPPKPGPPVAGSTTAASGRPPGPPPGPSVPPASGAGSHADTLAALQYLLETGVITTGEYEELRARVVA
jgi:hypothetical protein